MTCLVTGGTGFLGSYVARALVERGQRVVCLDIDIRRDRLDQVLGERAADVRVVQGDLTYLHTLLHVLREHDVTHIVHLGAILAVACDANPPLAVRVNVGGMVNVLEASRLAGIRRLVWASSASVMGGYGDDYGIIPNDASHRTYNVYSAAKSFQERLAEHYFKAFGVDSIGLRFGMMIGAGKRGGGASSRVSQELLEKPAIGQPSELPWSDDTVDWLWVEDSARAVALACEAPTTVSRAFNLKGDYRTLIDAATYVQRILPEARITLLPGKFGFAHPMDASAIKNEIGWEAHWTMEMQLKAVINEIRRMHGLPAVE